MSYNYLVKFYIWFRTLGKLVLKNWRRDSEGDSEVGVIRQNSWPLLFLIFYFKQFSTPVSFHCDDRDLHLCFLVCWSPSVNCRYPSRAPSSLWTVLVFVAVERNHPPTCTPVAIAVVICQFWTTAFLSCSPAVIVVVFRRYRWSAPTKLRMVIIVVLIVSS